MDGEVYGQPLVVGSSVIAATENNTVYAFDMTSGARRWQTHLGSPVRAADLPCGNIDPLGITGTAAYDATTNTVFVVAETAGGIHDLVGLDPDSGTVRLRRNLDVGGRDRVAQQQRGALAVANGRVYVPFGGLYGDCGDYVGYVASSTTNGIGPIRHWAVPTTREGGIWAASGPAIAADGSVYAAVGNGAASSGPYDGSDAIVRLSPDLSTRLDYFAPKDWASQNSQDLDLGSTGPMLLTGGRVLAAGKDGSVYLLDANRLGGIGGEIQSSSGCTGFGGMAADAQAVFVPCAEGLQRFDVTASTLTPRWRVHLSGSPVVGGGAVWALDTSSGMLHVLDEGSGAALASLQVGAATHFASPTVVARMGFVGTKGGVTAFRIAT